MSALPPPAEKAAAVRDMFDRISPSYDRVNRLMTFNADQRWRRELVRRLRVGPGDLVLDLACGTGDFAEICRKAGATAVGIPARIIPSKTGESADVTTAQSPFLAYGITQEDDPVSQAMKGLIDNASSQEHQIALLWQAIEKLSENGKVSKGCVPDDAALQETFEAEKLNQLMGK
jgi:SAM-dependent methyltransferase